MKGLIGAAALALGAPTCAMGLPTTYEFTGSGELCSYLGVSTTTTCSTKAFSGTVSLDVLSATPSGPGSILTPEYAYAPDGWVIADFVIQWSVGEFAPAPATDAGYQFHTASVQNELRTDIIEVEESYLSVSPTAQHSSMARMYLVAMDTPWLNGVYFPEGSALTLPGGELSYISFSDYTQALTGRDDTTGFYGYAYLDSFTVRPTTVPEPDVIEMLGAALVGFAIVRRARRDAARSRTIWH